MWNRGTFEPGIDRRNCYFRTSTLLTEEEGNTHRTEIARRGRSCAVEDPCTYGTSLRENREISEASAKTL